MNYPHQSGDFTVIGPECFTDAEATVIAYKGQNYYLGDAAPHMLAQACICTVTDPKAWTMYGGAVEPGSTMEPDPGCPEHFPEKR
jgi:hypothetical protein